MPMSSDSYTSYAADDRITVLFIMLPIITISLKK